MNSSPWKTALSLRQGLDDAALSKYLLGWIVPAVVALLVSITIRFHSLFFMQTMVSTVNGVLAVTAVCFLILMSRGCRLSLPKDVAVMLLAMTTAAFISVLGSGQPALSLVRLELYVSVGLLTTAVYLLYRHEELPLEAYFLAIAVVHLPFLFSAILWIKDLKPEPPFWIDSPRLAHFAHVRHFSVFGYFAAVSATGLGLVSRRFVAPSLLLALAAVFGLILTGSRGATLAWILFVTLACCFSRARLWAAIHGLIVLALAAGLVWYLHNADLLRSPNIFVRISVGAEGNESLDSARLEVWRMALQQIAAHPWFGSGPEGYLISGCCFRQVLQAHNFLLQFLLEFGLVGCGIAALLCARGLKEMGGLTSVARLSLATPGNRVLACLLASYFAYSLIDQTMYHVLPLLLFALFAGLFLAGLVRTRTLLGG